MESGTVIFLTLYGNAYGTRTACRWNKIPETSHILNAIDINNI
jgi:hypothetical protein